MFKGILPSKRIVSSEFTMITPLCDTNGKENSHPMLPQTQSKPVVPTGPPSQHPNKLAKPSTTVGKGRAQNPSRPLGTSHSRKNTVDATSQPCDTSPPNDISPPTGLEMNLAFDHLLDDLQIPASLRPKLLAMDATVKAAMLKSSHTITPKLPDPPQDTSISSSPVRSLRRPRSIDSMTAPAVNPGSTEFNPFSRLQASAQHVSLIDSSPKSPKHTSHHRGSSFDAQRLFSRSQINLLSNASALDLSLKAGGNKEKSALLSAKSQTPIKMISFLQASSSMQIDIESIKKLRLLLRNESASWTEEFVTLGGYNALMCRLNEMLEVEWREEQHDDQALHELLRCFKALATSAAGSIALRSACPNPFDKLVSLLYSDKKPGEVATRQLIAELLLTIFDLYPSPREESFAERLHSMLIDDNQSSEDSRQDSSTVPRLPSPHTTLFSFMRALLLTPAPRPVEAPAVPVEPHEFIDALHRPRIYKVYLQELADVCRDYFWVFCHPNNTIWVLEDTDESRVEKPRAPGGMTGGVEFEAMCYFATHFRLVNAMARAAAELNKPKSDPLSPWQFHQDLFSSGFERILCVARKASTTYYPTLHLELARYVVFARNAGFELPWTVQRLIGKPPTGLCKNEERSKSVSAPSTPRTGRSTAKKRTGVEPRTPGSPSARYRHLPTSSSGSPPPMLPSPKRVGPIMAFD